MFKHDFFLCNVFNWLKRETVKVLKYLIPKFLIYGIIFKEKTLLKMGSQTEKFGFVYLHKYRKDEPFTVHSSSCKLFESVIECIQEAMKIDFSLHDNPEYVLKIAYFKVLNNDNIVRELHSQKFELFEQM